MTAPDSNSPSSEFVFDPRDPPAVVQPTVGVLDFGLPAELEASAPPEVRGLARDDVRLLVSYLAGNRVVPARFRDLEKFFSAGDLLVINTSGTLKASLPAKRIDGKAVELHLSTHLPADLWVVELRLRNGATNEPFYDAKEGETLILPANGKAVLHLPYAHDRSSAPNGPSRLWIATLHTPDPLENYLEQYGSPIRYSYVKQNWSSSYYQTVYATELGSAEMPSAGRAFTPELITRLIARGVQIVPLILHAGVASLEEGETSYEEFYRVPPGTARAVNSARMAGKLVVAVGTTVVRALETVTDGDGVTHAGEGLTSLIIRSPWKIKSLNALLTGFHQPRATHLAVLDAFAGRKHLEIAYAEAIRDGYLWHEFGDLHLMLP